MPANRISAIVAGERTLPADTALRLGVYFGMDPEFWINLQGHYDLRMAARQVGDIIKSRSDRYMPPDAGRLHAPPHPNASVRMRSTPVRMDWA